MKMNSKNQMSLLFVVLCQYHLNSLLINFIYKRLYFSNLVANKDNSSIQTVDVSLSFNQSNS